MTIVGSTNSWIEKYGLRPFLIVVLVPLSLLFFVGFAFGPSAWGPYFIGLLVGLIGGWIKVTMRQQSLAQHSGIRICIVIVLLTGLGTMASMVYAMQPLDMGVLVWTAPPILIGLFLLIDTLRMQEQSEQSGTDQR